MELKVQECDARDDPHENPEAGLIKNPLKVCEGYILIL